MGNLAKQLRHEQRGQQEQQRKADVGKNKADRKGLFSPGEKLLGLTFGALVCFGSVHIISNQASIYVINKEIQDTKTTIQEQHKLNSDLNIQVSELSQYDRIRAESKRTWT